jgi:hypothetical protein
MVDAYSLVHPIFFLHWPRSLACAEPQMTTETATREIPKTIIRCMEVSLCSIVKLHAFNLREQSSRLIAHALPASRERSWHSHFGLWFDCVSLTRTGKIAVWSPHLSRAVDWDTVRSSTAAHIPANFRSKSGTGIIPTAVGDDPSIVMAGHSRPKDGVAFARLRPAIHAFATSENQDVDARDKRGHDEP